VDCSVGQHRSIVVNLVQSVKKPWEGEAEWLASPARDRKVAGSSQAFARNLYHYDAALMPPSSRLHHCLPWRRGTVHRG
jgi:hypothetical protein